MSKVISGIYKIENKLDGKVYIGRSKNVNKRWNQHIRELNKNKHHSSHLQCAWLKYGKENFTFSIIEIVENANNLIDREQHYLDLTKCYDSNYGYNISPTSDSYLGLKRTKEEKELLSKVNSGEGSPQAKITNKDAIIICKRIISGESVNLIARDYPKGIVAGIKYGKTWKHISKDYIDFFPKKELVKESNKIQKEKIISEQIFISYIHFIDSTVKKFGVTKSFIDKSISEYDKYVDKADDTYADKTDKTTTDKSDKKEIVRNERINKKSSGYLFSGLIKCLDCSHKYRGKMHRKNAVYICSGYHNRKTTNCERFTIHEKDLLTAIDVHFKSNVIDLNLVDFIEVESKTVKIYYTDGSYSVL